MRILGGSTGWKTKTGILPRDSSPKGSKTLQNYCSVSLKNTPLVGYLKSLLKAHLENSVRKGGGEFNKPHGLAIWTKWSRFESYNPADV